MKTNTAETRAEARYRAESSPTKTLTLRDTAKECRHCGQSIAWTCTTAGKYVPTEPATGRDHRENCTGISPATRVSVRDKNHESAVKGFFRSVGARV